MKKIVVLSKEGELKSSFNELENHYLCEVITFNFDQSSVFENLLRDDQALLLISISDWSSFDEFYTKYKMDINGTIVLVGNTESFREEKISTLCTLDRFIKGTINIDQPSYLQRPWFNLLVNPQIESIDTTDLDEVGQSIEKVMSAAINELQRVKEIHEKLVPIREESFKGMSATSKFAAGESAGGEFFDIISSDTEMLLLLARSRSYLVSSIVMNQFDELRSNSTFSDEKIDQFIKSLNLEVENSKVKEDKRKLDILFVRVDLKKMISRVWKSGNCELLIDGKNMEESEFSIERGQKLFVLSSGLLENAPGKVSLLSTVKENVSKSRREILDEVFYNLKKEKSSMFLSHDATMIIFEVNKNAIIQI
ncbi:hypothetical protein BIY24_14245 [Halobacteriovorax marinus]|uniref:hypothetical protein n=1 Tax=Halobacteriovorax marinus TaxID=97084 RepID=UPI000BC2E1EB|nr:hypothetical protein [Halobacteriovorax marinus]ATH09061.1 hypothetical protein BIY24_14245 [Halobacteriovorax marinus]